MTMTMIITAQDIMTTMMMMVITTQIPFVTGGTSDSMGASDPAVEECHPLTTNLWVFHFCWKPDKNHEKPTKNNEKTTKTCQTMKKTVLEECTSATRSRPTFEFLGWGLPVQTSRRVRRATITFLGPRCGWRLSTNPWAFHFSRDFGEGGLL